MVRLIFLVGILLLVFFPLSGQSSQIPNISVNDLLQRIERPSDTIYVVNFWATWCQPCVKEIPEFNKIPQRFNEKPVKVVMASLDFPNQKDVRLIPFLKNHQVTNQVILLITPRGGEWISGIDSKWSGAIPATLIIHRNKKLFYEGELTFEEISVMMSEVSK